MIFVPAVFAAALTAVGALERDRARPGALGILAIVGTGVAVLVSLIETHDPEVGTGDFAAGLLIGTLAAGLLPAFGYYLLGGRLGGRWITLAVVWLLTQVPLAVYVFVVYIAAVDLTDCPPDAYECPL